MIGEKPLKNILGVVWLVPHVYEPAIVTHQI